MCVIAWLIAIIYSIVPLPGLADCYGYRSSSLVCIFGGHCHSRCKVYIPARYIGTVMPACILPGVLYICMYCKAKKLKKNSSTASAEKPKSDYKVAVTFFLLFLSTLLLIIPASSLGLLATVTSSSEIVTVVVSIVSTSLFRVSSITDPIFILRNETAKAALYQLVKDVAKKLKSSKKTYEVSKLTELTS